MDGRYGARRQAQNLVQVLPHSDMGRQRTVLAAVDLGSNGVRLLPRAPAGPASLRRMLLREIEAAARGIGEARPTPRVVHETRKRIKRVRAALALLRPALGGRDYQACNGRLRAAGRSLAEARDATVLTRTYARMLERSGVRPARAARLPDAAPIVEPAVAAVAAAAQRHLLAARDRLARAPLSGRGWSPLGAGARAIYRRGRRRLPDRNITPGSEQLHDWRRHVKRYWHLLELFESVNPRRIGPAIADARRLSDLLGEEHDLAMLSAHLRRRRPQRQADDARVLQTIARRREQLVLRALPLGAKVYRWRAGEFERRLREDWKHRRGRRPRR